MVNTLALSGLRADARARHAARRRDDAAPGRADVRHESVITALIGAALGLPLGVFLAVLVTRALSQFDVAFAPPWRNLIVFAIVAVFVGCSRRSRRRGARVG